MRTQRTLAGISLLLLLGTTRSATINGRIEPKREVTSTTQTIPLNDDFKEQTSEIPVAYNSGKINNDLLSLTDSQNVVPKQQENVRTSADQQVDQSQMVLIEDIENMEDALSVMEYEPQKINKKDKRKISVPYKNPDITEFNGENKDPVPAVIGNTYYDPAPITKAKKISTTPKYYRNPSQESPTPLDSESRSRSRDTEYSYPVPTIHRSHKSRSSKSRPSVNSRVASSPEETKLENPPSTSITPSPRPYPSSSSELKKQRQHSDAIITSTPSYDPSRSTKSIRKKKIRKRPRDKATNNENSYEKSKPRRTGSLSSIDAAKTHEESNSEKSNVEGVAFNPGGGSINRNQPNAANNKDDERLIKVIDHVRSPSSGSSRKLYEKKHVKGRPVSETKAEDSPLSSREKGAVSSRAEYYNSPLEDKIVYKDGSKLSNEDSVTPSADYKDSNVYKNVRSSSTPSSSTYGEHTDSNIYKNDRTFATPSSFVDDEDDNTPTTLNSKSYRDYKNSDEDIRTSVTPSNFEEYENTPVTSSNSKTSKSAPPSSLESYEVIEEDSKVPTVTPSARIFHTPKTSAVAVYSVGPSETTDRSYYSPSASTLPVRRFEASTWTPKTKLKRFRETKLEEEDEERSSDIVAEATNLGGDEPEGSKDNRRSYEEDSSNERQDRNGQAYRNRGNHGNHNERYAQKYDEKIDDVQAEGTHGEEKYEGSKEGTTGGGEGKGGGKGEFEEGEGGKHEEGHHELEDEKGEKGYESWHKEEKGNKGHHDKEQHSNHYEEEDAKKKEHKEDGEYHEEHQQGEKGEKAAEFDEKGKHQKGYNTKGEHSVHKKDEFEKRTEFFDEFHEGDDTEKDGEFHREHESSKGGHEKVGHLDKADHEEHHGKKGKHENGKHYHEEKGHKLDEGKEAHYEHEDMHGGKKGQEEEKKWAYKKGDGGGDDGKDGGKGHESDH